MKEWGNITTIDYYITEYISDTMARLYKYLCTHNIAQRLFHNTRKVSQVYTSNLHYDCILFDSFTRKISSVTQLSKKKKKNEISWNDREYFCNSWRVIFFKIITVNTEFVYELTKMREMYAKMNCCGNGVNNINHLKHTQLTSVNKGIKFVMKVTCT